MKTNSAGRELDLMVANKIMELPVVDIPFNPGKVDGQSSFFTDEAYREWYKTYPNSASVPSIPHYSTNHIDCAKAEAMVEAKGRGVEYAQFMCNYVKDRVFEKNIPDKDIPESIYVLYSLLASPMVKCYAMLEAIYPKDSRGNS